MLLNNRYDNTKTMSTMYTIRITIQINNIHNTNNIQTMKITTQNNKLGLFCIVGIVCIVRVLFVLLAYCFSRILRWTSNRVEQAIIILALHIAPLQTK